MTIAKILTRNYTRQMKSVCFYSCAIFVLSFVLTENPKNLHFRTCEDAYYLKVTRQFNV